VVQSRITAELSQFPKSIGLVELGVLEWQPTSEWASASFIQPKKNGTVRFLTDFRRVNELLIRKPFPLPKISVGWRV
jgi:hypothetical protein